MPSAETVVLRAMTSGTGVLDTANVKLFKPEIVGTSGALSQRNRGWNSKDARGEVKLTEITKVCARPGIIVTGVSSVPSMMFVAGLVVAY